MLFDFCKAQVAEFYPTADSEGLRMAFLRRLAVDPGITDEDFDKMSAEVMAENLHDIAGDAYQAKETRIAQSEYERLSHIRATQPQYQFAEVELSDGHRVAKTVVSIDRVLETKGEEVIDDFEKRMTLSVIDDKWKEHLREMDELKTSVQNAVYEQKDPLLIYKFEAFNLFQKMMDEANGEVLAMLHKSDVRRHIEMAAPQQVKRDDFSRLKSTQQEQPQRRSVQPVSIGGGDEGDEGQRPLSRRERREMERKQPGKKK